MIDLCLTSNLYGSEIKHDWSESEYENLKFVWKLKKLITQSDRPKGVKLTILYDK